MEKKKVVPVWMSVILLVLCILGIGSLVYNLINMYSYIGFSLYTVGFLAGIISSVFAILYCILGYKKSVAVLFKAYCVSVTISYMITSYLSTFGSASGKVLLPVVFFALQLQCGLWFVLSIAKDLGKKKSMWICGIMTLLQLLVALLYIPEGLFAVMSSMAGVVNYVITFIMFSGKYKDKEARGTN